ncbi:DUF2851 family protein [Pontibacter sp. BT310]|uniref:DUF2851 family protein n=1 Tax=Pontibacter populi TaxID=890055 RepID=A0ABS6XC31_9BACT|nr:MULTISPECIES: DUF2851 family protein [Pontibacter]MBJ6118697.1 DUF2851 family protein [Pontibacter sp. BT310]MBR0571126.1 DUF2851 family protein [Microvirga sp. STS03]MBW3365551.1 DUF2851 family protein [Pontibacter populi]
MKEDFLHYIWQHQYYRKTELATTEGEPLQVLRTGYYNTDAGPDFREAIVKIGEVEWSGSVEIHLRASDWRRHNHQIDLKYDQVILHVVWEADEQILRTDGTIIPVLELKDRVDNALAYTYRQLQEARTIIPCANVWPAVPEITKTMMLGRALTERLEQKGHEVLKSYTNYNHDWEATAYHVLFKGFGFKINQEPMERLVKTLPATIVRKQQQLFQLEALLFGQAGFLADADGAYAQQLAKEYSFLSHKYSLGDKTMQRRHWNFMRMRPANFPTIRLAQLAAVLANRQSFFTAILEAQTIKHYEALFMVPVSEFWQEHFTFTQEPTKATKTMGKGSAHNLVINVAVPLLAAYAQFTGDRSHLDKAIELLEKVKEASNKITRLYEELGWKAKTAADNQAALSLYKNYCQPVNCLQCAVGNKILKQNLLSRS